MKNTLSIIVVCLLNVAAAHAQEWKLRARITSDWFYPPWEVNEIGFMGNFIKIVQGTKTVNTSIFTLKDGLQSVANIQLIENYRSRINDAKKIGNRLYVVVEEGGTHGQLKNRLKYIENGITYDYSVKFSTNFKIHPYENGKKMLIYGSYDAEDKEGFKVLKGGGLLDLETQIINPVDFFIGQDTKAHSLGRDGTLGILRNSNSEFVLFNEGQWLVFPTVPDDTKQICVVTKDSIFRVGRRSSDGVNFLYQKKGTQWANLGRFSSSVIPSTVDETEVYSLEYFKEKLLISHSAVLFEGVPVNNIFAFDLASRTVQNIPYPPGLNRNNIKESFIKIIEDSIYLVENNDNTFLGSTRIWSLSFTQSTAWQYTFTGNGNWSNEQNWAYGFKPPETLPVGKTIVINPAGDGECVLDVQQTIQTNAGFQVAPGKRFRVTGDLIIGN